VTDDSTTPAGNDSDSDAGTGAGARPSGTGGATPADSGRAADTGPAAAGTGAAGGAPRSATRRPRQVRVSEGDEKRRRNRRRWIIGGVAGGAALVILLVCVAIGALARLGFRAADRAGDSEHRAIDTNQACVDLETRLNRLVPPGATGGDPGRRAAAIRDENVAVRLFLADVDDSGTPRKHRDGVPGSWLSGWQMLLDARTAYANALDRQVTAGEPAFFVAPKSTRGGSLVDSLERSSPESCEGAVRRLARPDL